MGTAVRKHLRDFIAIAALLLIALATTWVILQEQRLRIPVLEERPFELKAEFSTAQAVVPGQGQTLRVAGVRVGDVESVELEGGRGVVTFAVDREFLPVYRDATILMRPATGLKDMFFEMDPGTKNAGEVDDGGTLPIENTAPDTNLDQILAALDSDTQAYLRLLLTGAGKGLDGRARDLGQTLGSLGPINRDLERVSTEVAKRRQNLARLIHNLNRLTEAVGRHDGDLTNLVDASNSALGAIAEQDPHVRRAVRLLDPTLSESRRTLEDVADYAAVLGPTVGDLRPFARNLDETNASVRELANTTTPAIRQQIRPLVRSARKPVRNLKKAAKDYSKATPRLTVIGKKINRLGNMAAYNPNGAESPGTEGRDEGYLYWAAWLGHNGNQVFSTQDANGLYRRIYFTASCDNLANILADSPLAPLVTNLAPLFATGGPCAGP
jgi:phospholipid/cholesterol/gamma-HCH transport system substrate-binding protein